MRRRVAARSAGQCSGMTPETTSLERHDERLWTLTSAMTADVTLRDGVVVVGDRRIGLPHPADDAFILNDLLVVLYTPSSDSGKIGHSQPGRSRRERRAGVDSRAANYRNGRLLPPDHFAHAACRHLVEVFRMHARPHEREDRRQEVREVTWPSGRSDTRLGQCPLTS